MGHFIDGEWHPGWYGADSDGRFLRPATTFRAQVSSAEIAPGRHHLFVSLACPWAHRTLLGRSLLGLEELISVSVVDWMLDDEGWAFNPDRPGSTPDHLFSSRYLRDVYLKADPQYTGRVTVPILWDRELNRIVNNESREILRQLTTVFAPCGEGSVDLAPPALRPRIEATLDAIYNPINNGVYRCGFAHTQHAYEEAAGDLFAALEHWEGVLDRQPFLCGSVVTEADICMFTTLLRFDPVYSVHFKCSRRRIVDYPNLWGYLRSLYQIPGVASTCNLDHIRNHYYQSHRHINPFGIVAEATLADLCAPQDRFGRFGVTQPLAQRNVDRQSAQ